MTPVQASAIPLLLSHKDVIVQAVTGSGKTLAFLIPVIEMLLKRDVWKKNEVGAVIVLPTRELAQQTLQVTQTLLASVRQWHQTTSASSKIDHSSLSVQLLVGGTSTVLDDLLAFKSKGGNILIGTPGRMEEVLKKTEIVNVRELAILVLDEADRLLDMGFDQSVSNIINRLPKQRRTGLFSATLTEALESLVKAGLRNPYRVNVEVKSVDSLQRSTENQQMIPATLQIEYILLENDEKLLALTNHIKTNTSAKNIIYFATCAVVDYMFRIFTIDPKLVAKKSKSQSFLCLSSLFKGITIFSLHGKMDQKRRQAVFKAFNEASAPAVLLTTDVASRGLDIPDVDWVIQFDPPQDPKSFSHRCGRTARAGKSGNALVFLEDHEEAYIDFLKIRQIPVTLASGSLLDKLPSNLSKSTLLEGLRSLSLMDREILDKSVRAFVSWIRYYQEHQASSIFQFKNINITKIANAFGIVMLPRMPELKSVTLEGFEQQRIDLDQVPFLNPQREKQRLANLSSGVDTKKKEGKIRKPKKQAWSEQKESKEKREARRVKRIKRQIARKVASANK